MKEQSIGDGISSPSNIKQIKQINGSPLTNRLCESDVIGENGLHLQRLYKSTTNRERSNEDQKIKNLLSEVTNMKFYLQINEIVKFLKLIVTLI